ncbi:hypothetical protein [Rhodococcus sp. 11-3]|uniref:hypothetical protein n=1 Tax=Rhodococcus sp. 11-3 TaxID=2854796 RepID=UPI00203F707A|nr:hypothetical protein [Rhodococcus sp. 11-3]USC16985.1 hypothetical protein KZJ41_09020 [Rhodococcus sp. 11-3]
MPNYQRLSDTLDYIKAHPESWNQRTWRCETGMCYAGTAADRCPAVRWAHPALDQSHFANSLVIDADGDLETVETWATGYFALTTGQADELFYFSNSIADLELIISQYDPALTEEQREALQEQVRSTAPYWVDMDEPIAFG